MRRPDPSVYSRARQPCSLRSTSSRGALGRIQRRAQERQSQSWNSQLLFHEHPRKISKQSHHRPEWDVIVIGGGATGLGVAVDAQTRGLRTLLLEAHDFAKATSSRSTKLVHGGVRYLEQGDIPLRPRGAARTRTPAPQRPAPRASPVLHRPALQMVGRPVLRHRHEGLRRPRRKTESRSLENPLARGNSHPHPEYRGGKSPRRRGVFRWPIRRLAPRRHPRADRGRSRRDDAETTSASPVSKKRTA